MPDSDQKDKNQKGSIDSLEEGLYSRNSPSSRDSGYKTNLGKENISVSEGWGDDSFTDESAEEVDYLPGKKTFALKVFLISLIFLVFALAVGSYFFFFAADSFSPRNVGIDFSAPRSVDGGEEFVMDLSVINGNNVSLQDVNLVIDFPQGTRDSEDFREVISRQSHNLGDIESGSESSLRFRLAMFGEVDSIRPVRVEIEYSTPGSTSRFTQEKIYEITIRSSPLVLSLSYPREINPVQDIELNLNVRSNTNRTLKDVLIEAEYPFGFVFTDSDPMPADEENVWFIGDLEPGENRDIKIEGRITGQIHDNKTFRFQAGIGDLQNPNTVDVSFVSIAESARVIEPFMQLNLTLDNSGDPEYFTRVGRSVSGNVSWRNNVRENVENLRVVVELEGDIFDRTSVRAGQGGFFESINNRIVWDRNVSPRMSLVNPGESGDVSFSFNIYPIGELGLEEVKENLDMFVTARISGIKISDSSPPENLSSFVSSRVMLTSDIRLGSRIVYSVGPLQNQGPIPPKAEQSTTYTVIWNTSSTLNDIEDAKVRATLPVYVDWVGSVHPEGEDVVYNSSDRSITWNVGEIKAGSGIRTTPKEVAFQVSFLPSLGQLNSIPVIVRDPILTGTDSFTRVSLEDSQSNLTTRLSTDPVHSSTSDARVTQ